MRYNERITLVKVTGREYDPETGKNKPEEEERIELPCNLSELGVERTNELFGQINSLIIVARLQRPYRKHADYALIDGVKYAIKRQSNYRRGVFYLESEIT